MAHQRNDHLIAALFESGAKAEQAVRTLELRREGRQQISLRAMALITRNDRGQIEYRRLQVLTAWYGEVAGPGAAGQTILAAPAALAGLGDREMRALLGTRVAEGEVAGAVDHVWRFREADLRTFGAGLNAGQVALLVHLSDDEARPTVERLVSLNAIFTIGSSADFTAPGMQPGD